MAFCSLVPLLLGLGLLASPSTAAATPMPFAVDSARSFIAVVVNGRNYQTNLSNLPLVFDVDFSFPGTVKPLTLSGLTLPSILMGTTLYSFTGLPMPLGGTLDLVTGAITTDPITGSIVQTPPGGAAGTAPLGAPLGLTTGTIPAISCGWTHPFSPATGRALSGSSGVASLIGTECVNIAGEDILIRLKIAGGFAANPIPEGGTAVLLSVGLSGIAWAGRRRSPTASA